MTPHALYNEIDPFASEWLRNLVAAGHIADGVVDARSITDLVPGDVSGPGQRHFFAGIAGWSLALRLAGVPDDTDVWTGSCPCQPFSSASRGRGGGFDSPKHLWPAWRNLIAECRPPIVFGEQVATGDGNAWLWNVRRDFEALGYAIGAADLCASTLGFAPRQRLFFVAYADCEGERARALHAQVASLPALAGLADGGQDHIYGMVSEVDGVPGAMGQRRAYGNAINPLVTARFIRAAIEAVA